MATGARRVGRRERATYMAGLASDIGVGAVENETGTKMIEGCLRNGGLREQENRRKNCADECKLTLF